MPSGLQLGVNVDHVATIRQARGTRYPDPVLAAALTELAGADQITVHLREDRRHIQDRDVTILRQTVQVPLNLEMAATAEMVRIAVRGANRRVDLRPLANPRSAVTSSRIQNERPCVAATRSVSLSLRS